ncbi:hypothetical protein HOP52_16210 [Halomonas campisalis]|uniref:Chromosome partition protein Smc n=1 Tax=Billgrantia campisalis TaxID=74661 RepID=A0ABS9PC00_9GAMM|nr:hypothetical protein [Halomonas campisalis]MCG6659303.1 hypothetical protein [Halomonas campisalis]MDR5864302.1 hypothetical protein [Halomonas campisalis]
MPTPHSTTTAHQPKNVLGKALSSLMPKTRKSVDSISQAPLSLKERLAYRIELKEQLASTELEAGRVHERINQQCIKQRQVHDELAGLTARAESSSRGSYPGLEGQLKAAKAELSRLKERITTDKHHRQQLHGEIGALRQGIQQLSQGAALEEVREHQKALQAAEAEMVRFEALVRDAQAAPTLERTDDDALDALQQTREDLLADIATGEAKPEELAALDAEIQEILSDSDGHQASALSQERNNAQTLAGLKRRLSAVQARLEALKAQTPEVIEQLLIARAEAAAEEYLAHAQALQLSCRQLQGIAELLTSAVPGASKAQLLSGGWPLLMIPTLPLQALREANHTDAGRDIERQLLWPVDDNYSECARQSLVIRETEEVERMS